MILPFDASALFAGMLLISGGWLAIQVSEEMRQAMKKDDALMEICAAAAEMLHMVDTKKYPIAIVKYNHIRRLASKLMTDKPKGPAVRTYSYKPELRAGK